MKQFTQEQAQEMYAALKDAVRWLDSIEKIVGNHALVNAMPNGCTGRNDMRLILAHADAQPIAQKEREIPVYMRTCNNCRFIHENKLYVCGAPECDGCCETREILHEHWQPKQPVSAPSADVARKVIAHMERPLRIVEVHPLNVMEMEEQAGIDATEELDHYTTPLPANGLAYAFGAQIAEEGVA